MKNTSLTPEQSLTAAYGVLVLGLKAQDVAVMLNVNIGRVSEACTKARKVFGIKEKAQ